jgi:glycosyltransferase involved in cell wall biosynthesis
MTKKFCFILPHFHLEYSGGAETQCYFLAQELLQRGWEVHYIRESKETNSRIMDGIRVHAIPVRKHHYKWKNYTALKRLMQQIKADVWYTRANISYLFPLYLIAKTTGGKVAWAFSRDSQFSYENKKQQGKPLLNAFSHANQWVFFRTLTKIDHVFVQTLYQQTALKEKFGLTGTLIYNAHPLPHAEAQAPIREQAICWIGRFVSFKQPAFFIALAEKLQAQGITCYMAGGMASDLENSVQQQSKTLPNLVFLGKIPLHEVHDLLGKVKILVNTSLYEGFSNTFIEAWMRGVPTCSLGVDPDQLIKKQKLGYVEEDIGVLAEKVKYLLNDADKWQKISHHCRYFAEKKFNIVQAVDLLESAIFSS